MATRRRGATLEHALLDAAWQELQESGYAKLTMERVAERAGTSRAVIYRRWRNRPELVIAAMRHRQPVLPTAIPDTGTLRGDMLAVLRRASARITETGPDTVIGMLSDLLSDEEAFDRDARATPRRRRGDVERARSEPRPAAKPASTSAHASPASLSTCSPRADPYPPAPVTRHA